MAGMKEVSSILLPSDMTKEQTLSEKEILEQVQGGDKSAYKMIVKRYMKQAYYTALGLVHNPQDAMDLSQEAFIKAFRNIKHFQVEKPFFPWFYRVMKNLCLDHLKKKRRIEEIPLDEARVIPEEREDREMKEVLWKGIKELPVEQREIVLLRYFQSLSYREIAQVTGKPLGTVMSSLYYSKKRLKGLLGKYLNSEEEPAG